MNLQHILLFLIILGGMAHKAASATLLFDEPFSAQQSGPLSPIEWFDLDADVFFTRDGLFKVQRYAFPTFDLRRKSEVLNQAGGFVVEIDIARTRHGAKWAAIGIGPETAPLSELDFAILVQSGLDPEAEDQAISLGKKWNLGRQFQMGQTIRIEIDSSEVGVPGKDATANAFFGGVQVVRNYRFQWEKGPKYVCLHTAGTVYYDNLRIFSPDPQIEFDQAKSSSPQSDRDATLAVVLKHAKPGVTYTVDYAAAGGGAVKVADYELVAGSLNFKPGQTVRPIRLALKGEKAQGYDKIIEVALAHPTGDNVRLGRNSHHIHTISGRWPSISFETAASRAAEGAGTVKIPVRLSHACDEPVEVRYAVAGGTATKGKDFALTGDGVLRFSPGETAREISVHVVDDAESENSRDETVRIALEQPIPASLGQTSGHTLAITDNEPGIEFDGQIWTPKIDKHATLNGKMLFQINDDGQLQWVPTYGTDLSVKLPPQRLDRVGDVVELTWLWKSDGPNVGSGMIDLATRWGSGDFRLFLSGSGASVHGNQNPQYGYETRFSPHVPTDATGGSWAKMGSKFTDGQYNYYGHNQPFGEFTPLIIRLERKSTNRVVYLMTMSGKTQTFTDDNPDGQPREIDKMLINFPNPRPFEYVILAKPESR